MLLNQDLGPKQAQKTKKLNSLNFCFDLGLHNESSEQPRRIYGSWAQETFHHDERPRAILRASRVLAYFAILADPWPTMYISGIFAWAYFIFGHDELHLKHVAT